MLVAVVVTFDKNSRRYRIFTILYYRGVQDLTSTACCDLDLLPPEFNQHQVISRDSCIFHVSFIKIVHGIHEILW